MVSLAAIRHEAAGLGVGGTCEWPTVADTD
jgi:hypothetical protein